MNMRELERVQIATGLIRHTNWKEMFDSIHSKVSGTPLDQVYELKITATGLEILRVKE